VGGILIELDIDKLSNKANSLIKNKKWNEAKKVCEELLEKFPSQIDGLDRKAQLYEAQGKYKQALFYAEETLSFIKKHPETCTTEMAYNQTDKINRLKKVSEQID